MPDPPTWPTPIPLLETDGWQRLNVKELVALSSTLGLRGRSKVPDNGLARGGDPLMALRLLPAVTDELWPEGVAPCPCCVGLS